MSSSAVEIIPAPSSFKSKVWKDFGFKVFHDGQGVRNVLKEIVICRHCFSELRYTGSTTNMSFHLQRHHPSIASTKACSSTTASSPSQSKAGSSQLKLTGFMAKSLGINSVRAQNISKHIGVFIAHDLRPFGIVESPAFIKLLQVLEPRYKVPSRTYFSQTVVPSLYMEVKKDVMAGISKAVSVALTTDGWTSRATESYITTTAHYISQEWKLENKVLETTTLPCSHTGEALGEALNDTATRWNTKRQHGVNCVVTDNASNITLGVKLSGLQPHIGCFAHTINLATKRGLGVRKLDQLVGRVRRVVSYFHRSPQASHVLKEKLALLKIEGPKKLVIDVSTRWNSTYDMLQRFALLEPAVMATLMTKEVRKDIKDVYTLSEEDVNNLEKAIETLQPLKTITTVLCDATNPTVSLILPLKNTILKATSPDPDDCVLIQDVKKAIHSDLLPRYEDPELRIFLLMATAIDPRFHSLPFISAEERIRVFAELAVNVENLRKAVDTHLLQVFIP